MKTEILDLNVGGILELLRPGNVAEAGKRLGQKADLNIQHREVARRLISMSDRLAERVNDSIAMLRAPESFYDAHLFNAARETIFNCLDLVSLASPSPVHCSVYPVRYDVDGINVQSLADLIKVTGDRGANLFADYWENEVLPDLEDDKPDFVGITITNRQQIIPGLSLARQLKSQGHFVVLGGTLFTKFAEQLIRVPPFFDYFADGVVIFEGETAILELANQLQCDRDFSRISNFLYPERRQVRCGRIHIEDLAALPTPDFAGLPLTNYLTPEPVLPVLFGKGCYFNRCKFCDIPYSNRISKKPYRVRPSELVVADLLRLNARFGCRHFVFTDETLPPKRLEALADSLAPFHHKGFRFVGYARLEPAFTLRLCQKLARSGLKKLFFGLESGAQETLDHMDKGIRVAHAPAVLKACRDAGINFHIFAILGFPEESEESAIATFEFFETNARIIDHPGNSFDIHPFGLELRTRYAEEAENLGLQIAPRALADEFIIGVESWTNTRGLTHERVTDLLQEFHSQLRKIYRSYHASPQHLWPAFEEFSVLYADQYAGRDFPYRTSLAKDTKSARYRLCWNPAALVARTTKGKIYVSSRYGAAIVGQRMYEVLANSEFRTVTQTLASLGASETTASAMWAAFSRVIDDLIVNGVVQLEREGQSG